MDEFTRKAVDIRMEKEMNKKGYFDICAVKDMWKSLDRSGYFHHSWQYKKLQILHCVRWEDIGEEMKGEIKGIIETILEPEPEHIPWYRRYFKRGEE